jgi:hypothetical protein
VSLDAGRAELVLGRRGTSVTLGLVSLSRPTRVLAPEVEVSLPALASATAACAQTVLRDLSSVDGSLSFSPTGKRLSRAIETLRRAADGLRDCARPTSRSAFFVRPEATDSGGAPSVSLALCDPSGRVDGYRKGADLYSILCGGLVTLRGPDGSGLFALEGPPFLVVKDLCRAAGELIEAAQAGTPQLEAVIGPRTQRLRVDLVAQTVAVSGPVLPCPPLALARSFLQAALDFCGVLSARNPHQRENPYLSALGDDARERLASLGELQGGDLFAEPTTRPAEATPSSGERRLARGSLRRLRYHSLFDGVDTMSRPERAAVSASALVVVGRTGATFVNPQDGAVLARRGGERAHLHDRGVLLAGKGKLEGVDLEGRPLFSRGTPRGGAASLTGVGGLVAAGSRSREAALCVFDGSRLAAVVSDTGRRAWEFHAPPTASLFASVSQGRAVVASDAGVVYGIDGASGRVLFRARAACHFERAPALSSSIAACLGRGPEGLLLLCLDAATGRTRSCRALHLRTAADPVVLGSRVAIGGVSDGESVVALFGPAGEERFRVTLAKDPGLPALIMRPWGLYCATRDGALVCLSMSGEVRWRAPPTGDLERALPPILRRNVLFAAGDPIRAFDPRTGALLCALPAPRGLSALAVSKSLGLYAVDEDGIAQGFRLATHLSLV